VHDNSERQYDQFTNESRERLTELIKQERYFHDMQLGGIRTGSWVYPDEMPPNYHLAPLFRYISELDLKNSRCLDIGTYDGMTAFVLAELGAKHIDATCQYDLDRFRLVRALQNYENISYFPMTDLKTIEDIFGNATFDAVLISAMLHHLTSPLDAILEARRLLKHHGYLIIESIILKGATPALMLNTEIEDPLYGVPTIWLPTESSLMGMLKLAGFEIVSHTKLLGGEAAREQNHGRLTILARAVKPSMVPNRTDKTTEIHNRVHYIGNLDIKTLEAEEDLSGITHTGTPGPRHFNIWQESPQVPLQPAWAPAPGNFVTKFSLAHESDFRKLVAAHPDDMFMPEDIFLLAARYPGEVMPEGMAWSLKQIGNLHILNYVNKYGLRKVLEIGAGFNFYFFNHLPNWADYATLDDAGFYDQNLILQAINHRKPSRAIQGMLGQFSPDIADGEFDTCISVSVLEHVPEAQIAEVCRDMFRVLTPGGWALHSIDLPISHVERRGRKWLNEMRKAGFIIELDKQQDTLLDKRDNANDGFFYEPLSISMRFYGGYKKSIWSKNLEAVPASRFVTILVAAYKPL